MALAPSALAMAPYIQFPSLLPTLLHMLACETEDVVRCSIVRVLGIMCDAIMNRTSTAGSACAFRSYGCHARARARAALS